MIAIAGPLSTATPNTVCYRCFAIGVSIMVVVLHSSFSIIDNNVNMSYIKTIASTASAIKTIVNTMASFRSFPSPQVCVIEGLSWWTGMAFDMLLLLRASVTGVQYDVVVLIPDHHGRGRTILRL